MIRLRTFILLSALVGVVTCLLLAWWKMAAADAAFWAWGVIGVGFMLLLLFLALEFGFEGEFRRLIAELDEATKEVAQGGLPSLRGPSSLNHENRMLFEAMQQLVKQYADKQNELISLSRTLSHDLRSPLTALLVATDSMDEVPEENRKLVRAAVSRIEEITHALVTSHRTREGSATACTYENS